MKSKITTILTFMLLTLALGTGVQAQITIGNCVNNTHLHYERLMNISGTELQLDNRTIECEFGCEYNSTIYGDACKEGGYDRNLTFLLYIFNFAWIFVIWRLGFRLPSSILLMGNSLLGIGILGWGTYVTLVAGLPLVVSIILLAYTITEAFK